MTQSHVGAPYQLIGRLDMYDQVEDINNYIERLDLYFVANDIAASKKPAVLLSALGPTVYKTIKSLSEPTPVTGKSYEELCAMLVSHYGPKRLVISERFRFYKRDRKLGETVAQYSVELQTLASPCKFGTFLDDALRDRLVCGIQSEYIQKYLLTKDGLTFQKAVEMAKTLETATKDLKDIKSNGDRAAVQAVQMKPSHSRRFGKPTGGNAVRPSKPQPPEMTCNY